MSKSGLHVLLAGFMLATTVSLVGCGGNDAQVKTLSDEVTLLKQEVAQLKTDMEQLKTQQSAASGGLADAVTVFTPKTVSFTDIKGYPTAKYVNELTALGLFEGLGDKFRPDDTISRGEFVEWLFKAHNLLKEENPIHLAPHLAPQFSDLKKDHPSYQYAQALANAGYSVGYDDKTFKPDQPITREEMIGIKGGIDFGTIAPDRNNMNGVWSFSDANKVDNRFTGYISVDGHDSKGGSIKRAFGQIKTFHPKQPVLRHQAAAVLWRMATGKWNAISAEEVLKKKSQN